MNWKVIKQNPNYSINEKGEVRSNRDGTIKKHILNPQTGYMYVDLWAHNQGKRLLLHRLLAEAFISNPENKPTVDHKDGNRQNNELSNLRWATYSEQNSRFGTLGVRSSRVRVTHFAEERKKRGGGHIAWKAPDEVRYFGRVGDVADYFGVTLGNISQMLRKGTIGQRGSTRGYLFEYAPQDTNV